MDWKSAMEQLQSEPTKPVYVLIGTETMLMRLFIQGLVQQLTDANQAADISKHKYEEEGAEGALFDCQTYSFFTVQNVVVLENCTAFLASSKAKHNTTMLEQYLENPVPDRVLVITVEADKVDERKKLFKLAKKHIVIHCQTPKESDAIEIVTSIASGQGILISREAVQELWRRTQNVKLCATELLKLWTYTNHEEIKIKDVQELVSAPIEDNVFQWIDSVVRGDIARAFRVLRDVQMGGHDTFALLAMIARQLRIMWYAKSLTERGYTQQQIATRVGAHPYAVKIAADQSRKFSTNRIEQLILTVADAEYEIKSGRRDMGQALEWVVASCALTMDKRTRAK